MDLNVMEIYLKKNYIINILKIYQSLILLIIKIYIE